MDIVRVAEHDVELVLEFLVAFWFVRLGQKVLWCNKCLSPSHINGRGAFSPLTSLTWSYSLSPSGCAAPSPCPLGPSAGRPAPPSETRSLPRPAASGGSARRAPPPARWRVPSEPDTSGRSAAGQRERLTPAFWESAVDGGAERWRNDLPPAGKTPARLWGPGSPWSAAQSGDLWVIETKHSWTLQSETPGDFKRNLAGQLASCRHAALSYLSSFLKPFWPLKLNGSIAAEVPNRSSNLVSKGTCVLKTSNFKRQISLVNIYLKHCH